MDTLCDATFCAIAALMHETVGLSFSEAKKPLVSSRLASRIQRLGLASYEDYLALISAGEHQDEFQMAVNLLTTNETYFFREPGHYAQMERHLNGRTQPISVWSAACSFGDEMYSAAMLLADMQQRGRIGSEWSLLGTDISERVLQAASEAVYPTERLRNVSPERLKRYCLRGEQESEGLIQMHPSLRQRVRFGWLNLCQPIENIGPFDVIFLRNVLIYFDMPTKIAVVERVLTQLRPGGLFFLGTAEGRVPTKATLQSLAPGAFRKAA